MQEILLVFISCLLLLNSGCTVRSELPKQELPIQSETTCPNRTKALSEEELLANRHVEELWEDYCVLWESIVEPTYKYLPPIEGDIARDTDFIAIAEYFRDHDYSEQYARMKELYRELVEDESRIASIFLRDMETDFYVLDPLIELGESYRGQEVLELTKEDRGKIVALILITTLPTG